MTPMRLSSSTEPYRQWYSLGMLINCPQCKRIEVNGMAISTLLFAKTLEGIMQTIKDILTSRKQLKEYKRSSVILAEQYMDLRAAHNRLIRELDDAKCELAAERSQKERYRTAFLDRMNVPVIGQAWDGYSDYFEES